MSSPFLIINTTKARKNPNGACSSRPNFTKKRNENKLKIAVTMVTYVTTEELEPFDEYVVDADLISISSSLLKEPRDEWGKHIEGMVMFRRIIEFRTECILDSKILLSYVSLIVQLLQSLRSVVSKNAALTFRDLFQKIKGNVMTTLAKEIVPPLMKRVCDNTNQFIRTQACDALNAFCFNQSSFQVIERLFAFLSNKNPMIRANGSFFLNVCFESGHASVSHQVLNNINQRILTLLQDSNEDVRKNARQLQTTLQDKKDSISIVSGRSIKTGNTVEDRKDSIFANTITGRINTESPTAKESKPAVSFLPKINFVKSQASQPTKIKPETRYPENEPQNKTSMQKMNALPLIKRPPIVDEDQILESVRHSQNDLNYHNPSYDADYTPKRIDDPSIKAELERLDRQALKIMDEIKGLDKTLKNIRQKKSAREQNTSILPLSCTGATAYYTIK